MNQSQNQPQDKFQFQELQMMCKETLYCGPDESAYLKYLTEKCSKARWPHFVYHMQISLNSQRAHHFWQSSPGNYWNAVFIYSVSSLYS